MNILIIEDEPLIAESVLKILSGISFVNSVDMACDFKSALQKASSDVFDMFLVDIYLGDHEHDGLDICTFIRNRNMDVPIVITTSSHSIEYLEIAFQMKVNDYLTKPFHPKELLLRVERCFDVANTSLGAQVIEYQGLTYDSRVHIFSWNGRSLLLSKRNKDLLLLFLREPEKLLSKQYLCEKYWGDYDDKPRNLRASIQDLRKALKGPCSSWISTIRGEGYVLKKDPQSEFSRFS